MNQLIIIGHGGHAKVVMDIAKSCNKSIVAILDDKYTHLQDLSSYYIGPVSQAPAVKHMFPQAAWVIAIGNNKVREQIKNRLTYLDLNFATLVHPTASIGSGGIIQQGTVVMPYAVINADASVGEHCIINSGSIVEHDSLIEDFVHIGPKSAVAGGVRIGKGCFIGIGASIIPGVSIGEWSTVGAGAAVIRDVTSYETVVGIPATPIKREASNHD
ncbi:MAG: acetyltransferase [Cohnella sp.]|uniref:acetyltransferase n=1 Tax=Cohnella sp. TaxID=1883426 RepID=UPI000E39D48D|nr:acetyltransferase [Cohnella sp.]REK66483.1 MAG: acetyltransferase [Cohnella sp.]